jgi:hypothetical protein
MAHTAPVRLMRPVCGRADSAFADTATVTDMAEVQIEFTCLTEVPLADMVEL